jgi:hypothetical protein
MKKLVVCGLVAGMLALALLQSVAAYTYYGSWNGDVDEERYCSYWDNGELEWKRDRVCEWMNTGDWKERTIRTRAAVWQSNSYDMRYNIQAGRSSGDAFYYHYGDKSETSPSDWRYKTTFDPRVDNEAVKGYGYYYYQPRYDYATQTFNWRF